MLVLCLRQPLTQMRTKLKMAVEVYHSDDVSSCMQLTICTNLKCGLVFTSTPNTNENHT